VKVSESSCKYLKVFGVQCLEFFRLGRWGFRAQAQLAGDRPSLSSADDGVLITLPR
jgi:hypothetical protein